MRVAAVVADLMLFSRIESAARISGASLARVDTPAGIPDGVELVLVDWAARDPTWSEALLRLRDAGARVVLFGPHTDLEAHAAARDAGLGPMMARSRLVARMTDLFGGPA